MFDDFLVRAIVAAVLTSLVAAPLGCFLLWRRMAYFGDATAHSAILGVALALLLNVPIVGGILAVTIFAALCVTLLAGRTHSSDTILGVISHGGLAIGLVAVATLPSQNISLETYLFGDILAVRKIDVLGFALGAFVILGLMMLRWSRLVTATFSPELAFASGQNPKREELWLALIIAVTVALAVKVVGVLLVAALLIIPAAAARPLARTPEGMAIWAAVFGVLSAIAGPLISLQFDTPAGPTIVCVALAIFVITNVVLALRSRT